MPSLVSARPAFFIDGVDQPALAAGLQELIITDSTEGMSRLEARFGNWGAQGSAPGYLWNDGQVLDFGKRLRLALGDDTLFEGRIYALESDLPEGEPPALTVLADDDLQTLRMVRRTRTFEDVTTADLVQRIAGDHGLTADVSLDGPARAVVAQLNQSDLAFLREQIARDGGELWLESGRLRVRRRTDRAGQARLARGAEIREIRITADLSTQATTLVVGGWDPAAKARIREEATDDVVRGEASANEDSGPSLLRRHFGERTQSIAHSLPTTADSARAEASARFAAICRGFVTARGVAETSAALRVGADLEFTGLGARFEGHYRLTELRHRFDAERGLRTEFVAERAHLGSPG